MFETRLRHNLIWQRVKFIESTIPEIYKMLYQFARITFCVREMQKKAKAYSQFHTQKVKINTQSHGKI